MTQKSRMWLVFRTGIRNNCRRMLSLLIFTVTRSGTCEYWVVTWDFRLMLQSTWQFAEYNQQDVTFLNLFISVGCCACFRRFFCPSSEAQNCTYSASYWSDKYLMLYVRFWAPDDGRKNHLKHVEHLTEINKLRNVASCWLYTANILAMHGPMNVKFRWKLCSSQLLHSV